MDSNFFNSLNSSIEEDKVQLQEDIQARQRDTQQQAAVEAAPEQTQEASTEEPKQESTDKADLGAAQSAPANGDDLFSQIGSGEADVGDYLRFGREMGAAPVQGGVDFAVGLYNNVMPGPDITPEMYQRGPLAPNVNESASVLRKIGELAVGERVLNAIGMQQYAATRRASLAKQAAMSPGLQKKVLGMINNSAFAQVLGKFGISAAANVAAVDVSTSAEEDNALGSLVQTWPKTWGPALKALGLEGLATGEGDGPDAKRDKNRLEALFFQGLTLPVEFVSSLVRNSQKLKTAVQWIPESEKATDMASKLNKVDNITGDDAVDGLLSNIKKQEKDMDDYGAWYLSKTDELKEPIKGVHRNFDWVEMGVRTQDKGGVVGASLDNTRIAKDLGTVNGRLGSMFSRAAMKFGLEPGNIRKGWLLGKMTDDYKLGKELTATLPDGTKVPAKLRDKIDLDLYARIVSPVNGGADIVKMLDKYTTTVDDGIKVLKMDKDPTVQAAILRYSEDFMNLDKMRTQGLAINSLNGQVADMAETIANRMDDVNIENMMEDVLDRLETLTILKEGADWDRTVLEQGNQFFKGLQNRLNKSKDLKTFERMQREAKKQAYDEIIDKSKRFTNTIREIAAQRPEFLRPLFEMYAATDGRVMSMAALNKEVENSLGSWTKAFRDGAPEIPQLTLQRFAGTVYNSVLSGFGTVFDTAVGNVGSLVDQFINVQVGARLMGSEGKQVLAQQRAAMMAMQDTFGQAMNAAGERAWNGFRDPKSIDKAFRPDLYMQGQEKIEALQSFAEAAAANGNDGPMAAFQHFKMMDDLQSDPIFRTVPTLMSTMDAFQGSIVANQTAKVKAFEKVFGRYGDDVTSAVPMSKDMKAKWSEVQKEIYNELYTADGILKEGTEAKYLQLQGALSLDTPIAKAFDTWTKTYPPLKALILFPKTMGNLAQGIVNYTPINAFADSVGSFNKPLKGMSFEYMQDALARRGIGNVPPEEVMGTFMRERARVRGRLAMGSMLSTTFGMMAVAGNMTGAEHRDPAVQRARGKDWKPYSVKIGGKYVSYELLGPPAKMIGLIPTMLDNFDGLSTGALEDFLPKISYTMASMFDDVNGFEMMRPIMDLARGKGGQAFQRLAASNVNNMIPLATQRREWGKLLNNTQRLYDRDFQGYMRNSNTWLDAFMPHAALPEAGDPITGKKLGGNMNPLMRVYNTYSPMPISDAPDPLRDFLIQIEWNGKDSMETSSSGVPLTTQEQSEMWQIIYRNGELRKDLQWIKQRSSDFNYIKKLRKVRRSNVQSKTLDSDDFLDIRSLVNNAVRKAKANAEVELTTYDRILTAEYLSGQNKSRAQQGETTFFDEVDGVLQLTQP